MIDGAGLTNRVHWVGHSELYPAWKPSETAQSPRLCKLALGDEMKLSSQHLIAGA